MIIDSYDGSNNFWFRTSYDTEANAVFMAFRRNSDNTANAVQISPQGVLGLFVNNSGNVGIGTMSPLAKLDITGDGSTILLPRKSTTGDPSGLNGMIYYNAADNKFRCYENGSWTNCVGPADNLGNHTATKVLNMSNYAIDNVSSMTITGTGVTGSNPLLKIAGSIMVVLNNGNVGIGTTNPQALLDIGTWDGWEEPALRFSKSGSDIRIINDNAGMSVRQFTSVATGAFNVRDSNDNVLLYVKNNGNVGIGTTGPSSKLEVVSSSSDSITMTINNDDISARAALFLNHFGTNGGATPSNSRIGAIAFRGKGTDGSTTFPSAFIDSYIGTNGTTSAPGDLRFYTNSGSMTSERMRIDANGNVGISTDTPQARLDVKAAGSTASDMVQIWRDSNGVIVGSMSATGVLMANKFLGDASGLTGIATLSNVNPYRIIKANSSKQLVNAGIIQGDNSGDGITVDASSLTVVNTALFKSSVTIQGDGTTGLIVSGGNVGIGTTGPNNLLEISTTVIGGLKSVLTLSNNSNQVGTGSGLLIAAKNSSNNWTYYGGLSAVVDDATDGSEKGIVNLREMVNGVLTNVVTLSGGNVGIGTTNPEYKLDVNGDSRIGGQAIIIGTATVQGNAFSVGGSTFVVIAGKVGIGTTNPLGKLHIVGSGDGNTFFGLTDSSISNGIVMSDNGTIITMGSGFVGISTNSPQARLDVKAAGSTASDMVQIWRDSNGVIVGSMSATGVMMASKFIGDGTQLTGIATLSNVDPYRIIKANALKQLVNAGIIQGDNLGDGITVDASSFTVVNTALFKSSVTIQGDGTTGLIVSGGNVGIGTTNPSSKLNVVGKTILDINDANEAPLVVNQSGSSWITAFYQNWNPKVVIDNSGNVGIGTTNPSAKLHVVGSGDGSGSIAVTNSGTITSGVGLYDNGTIVTLGPGKVGIGTMSPATKLHVAGKITLDYAGDGSTAYELKVSSTSASPSGYYAVYAP